MCDERVVTCAFCGAAYPEGTPTHGAQILEDHIRVCRKHPMRSLEVQVQVLESAARSFLEINAGPFDVYQSVAYEMRKVRLMEALDPEIRKRMAEGVIIHDRS